MKRSQGKKKKDIYYEMMTLCHIYGNPFTGLIRRMRTASPRQPSAAPKSSIQTVQERNDEARL